MGPLVRCVGAGRNTILDLRSRKPQPFVLLASSFSMSAMSSVAQVSAFRRAAGYNVLATAGVLLVAVFVICALFAPWIAPQDPAHIDLPSRLMAPSAAHWLG